MLTRRIFMSAILSKKFLNFKNYFFIDVKLITHYTKCFK